MSSCICIATMVMKVQIVRDFSSWNTSFAPRFFTSSELVCACLSCDTWGYWMYCQHNYTGHICMAFLQCACAYGFSGFHLVCTNNRILCNWRTCSLNVWACVFLDYKHLQRRRYIACIWKAYLLNVSACDPWEHRLVCKSIHIVYNGKAFLLNGSVCVPWDQKLFCKSSCNVCSWMVFPLNGWTCVSEGD